MNPKNIVRIWRSPESKFNEDEPLNCLSVYTPSVLKEIADNGFNAIWLRGKLGELINSKIFRELNEPQAKERITNLAKLIADAKVCGIKVFLYFNEPLAIAENNNFWQKYPEIKGEPHFDFNTDSILLSFCTSTPEVMKFFQESVDFIFGRLTGLGGVILITASELHTHCYSHNSRLKTGDKYMDVGLKPLACPKCAKREPADIVIDLINVWKNSADKQPNPPEIWAWNWSWSRWYEHPQKEIIERLPPGVKLMGDFERGSMRKQSIGDVFIDEYSLGFVGPGDRFKSSRDLAKKLNLKICAKLQIGTTHELATVPNIPLVPNLYDKLAYLSNMDLTGIMCSWNFGNSLTLNTFAFNLFFKNKKFAEDKNFFLDTLISEYFGTLDSNKIKEAWKLFCTAFAEYPFSIPMLYQSPMNYAPAFPLSFHYEGREMGPSWIQHSPWGDNLENCLSPFSIDEVITCFKIMNKLWKKGFSLYKYGLEDSTVCVGKTEHETHIFEELSSAEMIGCHLKAMLCITRFHKWRNEKINILNLKTPCTIPEDETGKKIIGEHLQNAAVAKKLLRKDNRLGYHQEPHAQLFF